jgi:VWFA-related protein
VQGFTCAVLLLLAPGSGAQTPIPPPVETADQESLRFSVSVDLVLLHATVRDRRGRFVNDLLDHDFAVYEDRVPQRIRLFEREDVPVTVGLVIDHSGSMRPKMIDPCLAVLEVSSFLHATSQLAQTTLRSVLGEAELDELLSQRGKLNARLQSILDQHTASWGMKVTLVEVKQVELAEQMIRAIARQAEAERERRAKVIHADPHGVWPQLPAHGSDEATGSDCPGSHR